MDILLSLHLFRQCVCLLAIQSACHLLAVAMRSSFTVCKLNKSKLDKEWIVVTGIDGA